MDIKHSNILSQQLSRYVGRIFWMFFIVLGLSLALFLHQSEPKINSYEKELQLNEEALLLKIKLQRLIDEALQQKQPSELALQHQNIIKTLVQFNEITHNSSLNELIQQANSYNDSVLLITDDLAANSQFLKNEKELIDEALGHLQIMLREVFAQKLLLEQRISNNKEETATLFKAYMELSEQQKSYQLMEAHLMKFSSLLKNLSPFIALSVFDEEISRIKKELHGWEKQHDDLLKLTSPFNNVYQKLSPLRIFPENGLLKWRDTLQKVESYLNFLTEEKLALRKLKYAVALNVSENNQLSDIQNVVQTYVRANTTKLNQLFKKHNIKWRGQLIHITPLSITFLLMFFIGLSLCLFVLYGIKCKRLSVEILQVKKELVDNYTADLNKGFSIKACDDEEIIDISNELDEENIRNKAQIDRLSQELHHLQEEAITQHKKYDEQDLSLEKYKDLASSLEIEKSDLVLSYEATLDEIKSQQKKLIAKNQNMIVRTLLQSQSASIGTGGNALQVYRHLTRMFDWCNQLNTPLMETSSSVSLESEISASLYKMMLEAQWQRNTILLNTDIGLSHLEVNAGLFQRMLVYVGRLLLLDQFKSTLILTITRAKSEEDGAHWLTFEFTVIADKNRKKAPSLVQEFINTQLDASLEKPEAVHYIHRLLNTLHAQVLNMQTQDTGYTFTFDLPLTGHVENEEKSSPMNLKLIALAEQPELIQVLKQQCSVLTEELTVVDTFNDVKINEIVERITDTSPIIFLLAEECYENNFELLQKYIDEQTQPERYKIMVLQSSYHGVLQRQGLYTQAASPMFPDVFIKQLQALRNSSHMTNLCHSPEVMSQYQYQATQAEVLFVSDKASSHQTLIRLLHWLGLQVNVVANAETMQRYWESGRYLIIMTDLALNPYVDLSVGKSIKRAVFTLKNAQNDDSLFTQMQAWASQRKESKSWVLEELSTFENIGQLVTQLSPWLKSKVIKPKIITSSNALVDLQKKDPSVKTPESDVNYGVNSQGNSVPEQAVIITETPSFNEKNIYNNQETTPQTQVGFDLSRFSINQGTPELAVYMLDEYITELSTLHENVKRSVQDNNIEQTQLHISDIKTIALIMAAAPLQQICEQLEVASGHGSSEKISILISQLSIIIDDLVTFSEKI